MSGPLENTTIIFVSTEIGEQFSAIPRKRSMLADEPAGMGLVDISTEASLSIIRYFSSADPYIAIVDGSISRSAVDDDDDDDDDKST